MRPLPTHQPADASAKTAGQAAAAPPSLAAKSQPLLLAISTCLAAIFCILYLQKPVIVRQASQNEQAASLPPSPTNPQPLAEAPLLPGGTTLPGDSARPLAADPRHLSPAIDAEASPYEETNLRIQHALTAQGPAGEDLGKIILEVPVLYQSRSLRWTPEQVARARDLMIRIGGFQEKSRSLREEGQLLMEEWNALVADSIPSTMLRADSPTLPGHPRHAESSGLDSSKAIELQSR
ncbi:MAG: hypothetical protein EAZ65_02475 [Verrucomicrobia bacterium]|nr:MAG: hypothetical protein EAZ82_02250 [Verrucomicrobiota bacterium]TAF27297.1 MAG: hypothetical protein EAZ71_02215 [Verrucomicrobiota bacterium]TAF42412.1 MAG: hypothetical protein EAZ65_02475 [Verrucomicrobiota bacterium]